MPVKMRPPSPGVSTLELDPQSTSVQDLKALIFSSTQIPPDEQEIKYSYPPKPLTETGGLLSSIPITNGEQLIVSAVPPSSPKSAPAKAQPAPQPGPAPTSARPPASDKEDANSVALPGRDAGYLQLRIVPDDNSCLFSAVAVVFEGGIHAAQKLRTVVADAIRKDSETYPEVVLGMPREEYIKRILKPETWGGAIELSIFADHYKTEIASFDVATGRCDRFGQDQYDSRCLLVYSGIHYDAITLSPLPVSPPDFHTSIFPSIDQTILLTADSLVSQLRARHYYTDTSNFDLRCGVCKQGLKGEKGATEHAKKTGHVEFGEY
ncbi:hypothetical protein IAR50_002946 [Cryptococcus sp. DSM 104548]